jgi:hypothetical protein
MSNSQWILTALLIGLIATVMTTTFFFIRRKKLGLMDFRLIAFGLTFGPGILASVFIPVDTLDTWLHQWPSILVLILSAVFSFYLSLLVIFVWELCFPRLALQCQLANLQERVLSVTLAEVVGLVALISFIQVFGVLHYGLVGSLAVSGSHAINLLKNRAIPYWYTSLRSLDNLFLSSALLLVGANLVLPSQTLARKYVFILLACLLLLFAFIGGRRILMYALIELVVINATKIHGLFKPKLLFALCISLVFISVMSNMYQYYRTRIGTTSIMQIISHWDDFRLTTENLAARMPDWTGDYLAFSVQKQKKPMMGAILSQEIRNNIPEILNPRKKWVYIKNLINNYYGLGWSHGFPITPTFELIGDWGPVAGLLVGVFCYIFCLALPAACALFYLRRMPLAQICVAGAVAYLLMNVELDFYSSIFEFWKYLAVVVLGAIILSRLKAQSWGRQHHQPSLEVLR